MIGEEKRITASWHSEGDWETGAFSGDQPFTVGTLQEAGVATVLIKQNYANLFYDPSSQLDYPVESMLLTFSDKDGKDVLRITLQKRRIIVDRYQEPGKNPQTLSECVDADLFAGRENARAVLSRKIWVQLNKLDSIVKICRGDIADKSGRALFEYDFPETKHEGWTNEEEIYSYPPESKINQRKKNLLARIRHFKVEVKEEVKEKEKEKESKPKLTVNQCLDLFLSVKVMNLVRVFDSALDTNPSILKQQGAILSEMPREINVLFEYLKNLNAQHLPDYDYSSGQMKAHQEYLDWQNFRYAIHFSLNTAYQMKAKLGGRPIGILNHLFKMKLKTEGSKHEYTVWNNKDAGKYETKEKLMEHIYNERTGYIRLELLPHQGLSPGSMAVLQVWPPFNCSGIHNHGDSFGLIKVLAGTITVQNFNELSFEELHRLSPFQQRDYSQDQYTWLSEHSFGIHRLINLRAQTCLSLQAYYHSQYSNEIFSFIDEREKKVEGKDTKILDYCEYYPQNDWRNYLEMAKGQVKNGEFSEELSEDVKFIRAVIDKYGLRKGEDYFDVDWSFPTLVKVMREEYELVRQISLAEETRVNFLGSSGHGELKARQVIWVSPTAVDDLEVLKKSFANKKKKSAQSKEVKFVNVEDINFLHCEGQSELEGYLSKLKKQGEAIKKVVVVLDIKFYNNVTLSDAAGLRLLKRLAREYRLENFIQIFDEKGWEWF